MEEIFQNIRKNLSDEELKALFVKLNSEQKPEGGRQAAWAFVYKLRTEDTFSKFFIPLLSDPLALIDIAEKLGYCFTIDELNSALEKERLRRWQVSGSFSVYDAADYFVHLMAYDKEFAKYTRGKSIQELTSIGRELELDFSWPILRDKIEGRRLRKKIKFFLAYPLLVLGIFVTTYFWQSISGLGWNKLSDGHKTGFATIALFSVLAIFSMNKSYWIGRITRKTGFFVETVDRSRSPGSNYTYEKVAVANSDRRGCLNLGFLVFFLMSISAALTMAGVPASIWVFYFLSAIFFIIYLIL